MLQHAFMLKDESEPMAQDQDQVRGIMKKKLIYEMGGPRS